MKDILNSLKSKQNLRRICLMAAAAILILIATAILAPRYRAYIQKDHRETCFKLDLYVDSRYREQVRESAADAGAAEDEQIIREIVMNSFEVELDEEMSTDALCREGGTVTFAAEEDPRRVHIFCTVHGEQYENLPVESE